MKENRFTLTLKSWGTKLTAIGVVIAVALSSGLVLSFEGDIGHFRKNAPMFYLLVGGVLAATAVSAYLGRSATGRFSLAKFPEHSLLSAGAAYFSAFLAAVSAAAELYDMYILHPGTGSALGLAAAILTPAITVFFLLGTHEKTDQSTGRVLFGILAVLSVTVHMFANYFDFTLPLNSPVRNVVTIAEAGMMLFLLSEVRLALDPAKRATVPFFTFTSAFAASVVFGISFGLCVFAFASPDAAAMGISVYRFACYFGSGLLALSRLLSAHTAAEPHIAPEPATKETDNT